MNNNRWTKGLSVVFLAAVLPLLGHAASAHSGHPSVPQASVSPEEVVRQFYDWYLHAHSPKPKRQNLAKFRKYVTQRFLRQQMAPDADADLFLGDTQDPDETWADNFSVSKAAIQGQRATVQVALNGSEVKYKLRVTLRRENGAWKIDGVKRI